MTTRTIKFRFWDKKDKRIVYLLKPAYHEGIGAITMYSPTPIEEGFELMQFTGLLDKAGKEIYEGDIAVVRTLHDGDEYVWNSDKQQAIPFKISWNERHCSFDFGNSCLMQRPYDYEIIGNIYENPELLK